MQVAGLPEGLRARTPSALALPRVFDYLVRVAVQDACAMLCSEEEDVAQAAANNAVIKFMLEKDEMRCVVSVSAAAACMACVVAAAHIRR